MPRLSLMRRGLVALTLAGITACAAQTAPTPVASISAIRPAPPLRARELVGNAPDAVEAVLGRPVLQRHEGPAEVWLYTTADGCRLDVILYGPKVATADTRVPAHMSERACLRAIAARGS